MHGCGNDFVLLEGPQDLTPARVRALCDRRTGIGADGIIVIAPGQGVRRAVMVHNADGSIADACGNGYRCVARYLLEGNPPDQSGSFFEWLRAREPVFGYRFTGIWLDIGDKEQLLAADNLLRRAQGLAERAHYELEI